MKKDYQQELIIWIKKQSNSSSYWLSFSRILGVINGFLIIIQAWILAHILHCGIMENFLREKLLLSFSTIVVIFMLRAWIVWLREKVGLYIGQHVCYKIRKEVTDKLKKAGPAWVQVKQIGSWVTLIFEQINDMHDYYAHYLPQMSLAICVPTIIFIAIFLKNWIAALILLCTSPLIPIFMIMIGVGAADANRQNFVALSRLSGYFLDRLRGMDTLRLFDCGDRETENIQQVSQDFREKTIEVLRLAFLSSGVLEFFTSLSIAMVAVYFGFSYLGKLDFGHYNSKITIFSGFFTLILAPEFFQPLRDLGIFYHSKAKAIGAADNLKTFLEEPTLSHIDCNDIRLSYSENSKKICIVAKDLFVLSAQGKSLIGPLNFILPAGKRVALVGASGSGKSLLLNLIAGFFSYAGSLCVNGIELRNFDLNSWRKMLSLVGQTPQLLSAVSLRDNIVLSCPEVTEKRLKNVLKHTLIDEFLSFLPNGIDSVIGDRNTGLSAGQIQRVAIARALLSPCKLLLLDEPTANLDINSEFHIRNVLNEASFMQSTLMVTHHLDYISTWDHILVMDNGQIVEQGNYETLCMLHGVFFKLLTSQKEKI